MPPFDSVQSGDIEPAKPSFPHTLATIRVAVEADPALSSQHKRDVISDLDTIGRWLSAPLTTLAANPVVLHRRIAALHPIQLGISAKRVQNVFASLRFALRYARTGGPRRHRNLTQDWQELRDALDSVPLYARFRLVRVMRLFSARGLRPCDIDDQAFVELARQLDDEMAKNPRMILRGARQTWNLCVKTVPGWPGKAVTPLSFRQSPNTMPLATFPASFQSDYKACRDRLASTDPFGGTIMEKPLAGSTIDVWMRCVLYAATALVREGQDVASIADIYKVASASAARAALRHYYRKAGNKPTKFTSHLAYVLKRVAQIYVGVDAEESRLHAENFSKMTPKEQGLTPKNKERLSQFNDSRCKLLLLQTPDRMAAAALKRGTITKRSALDLMCAAMVATLISAPIRLGNLVGIDQARHVRWPSERGAPAILHFDAHEVKNRQELTFELDREVVNLLRLYIEKGRPLLMDPDSTMLFPQLASGAGYLSRLISGRLKRYTGLVINTHLFRHTMAKFYLDEHPGDYETIRIVLGHKSVTTTIRFYCGLERDAAVRHYDKAVLGLRKDLEAKGRVFFKSRRRRASKKTTKVDAIYFQQGKECGPPREDVTA